MKHLSTIAIVAAGIAATVAPTTTSYADEPPIGTPCTDVRDTVGPHFEVKLCDVTDVDQFRTNLYGNGNVYCGPASLYNILYYLGEHKGLPVRASADDPEKLTDFNPTDPKHQNAVGGWINWLGFNAGMGPTPGGSGAGGNRAAFDAATAVAKSQNWFVNRGQTDTHTTPEFGFEMAKRVAHAPVQMWYGRYTLNDDNTLTRGGGHIVTVVSAEGDLNTGKVELTLADPGRAPDHGNPGYLDGQSTYRYETVTLYRMAINVKVVPENADPYVVQRTYWRLLGENYTGDTFQFVEGYNWFQAAPPVG